MHFFFQPDRFYFIYESTKLAWDSLILDRRTLMMFGSFTSLHFLPGQQLKALHFCTKSDKIMENDSKEKINAT